MVVRTILCFGDSNTHGTMAMRTETDRRRHPKAQRWTSVMAAELGAKYDVIPEGHPGRTSVHDDPSEGAHKNGLRHLQAILESHRPLDLVVLMVGTNDLKARFGLSAHDVALGVERLVVLVRSSDCGPDAAEPKVLLAAPVAVSETGIFQEIFKGAGAKAQALPALLRNVATRQNADFADMNDVATVYPVDGVHLDADAHAAIGAALARAVRAILK